MSSGTRQLGRQANNQNNNVSSSNKNSTNVGTTNVTRSSASTPPRRYVLDVPRSRRSRQSRTTSATASGSIQDIDLYNSNNRPSGPSIEYVTLPSDDSQIDQQVYRSGSFDYISQDQYLQRATKTTTNDSTYYDDATIKKLIESGVDDQEVQRLTSQSNVDIRNYPINVDNNPELLVRPNNQRLTYRQDISVRYLKPNAPPPPGPIVIREVRAPAPPPAPPIILRQRPPPPRTPSPIIIREKPPQRPKSVPTTVVKKIIPPPPPPPRQVIIERMPKLPPKPRPVIIERWLPYHQVKRKIVYEKAKPIDPPAPIKNRIIEWRSPEVEIVKQVRKLGIQQIDPQSYYTKHGDQLYTTEFVQRKFNEFGLQDELTMMQEQYATATKEQIAMEQADEYNVRKILNDYGQRTSRQTTNPVLRVVRSSSNSGLVDEYGEQQIVYDQSTSDSTHFSYEKSGYINEGVTSNLPVLTEDILLRAHSNSGGKFPSQILTKLGSQIYEIPSDQIDLSSIMKSTSNSQFYNNEQSGIVYQYQDEDIGENTENYKRGQIVELSESDFQKLSNKYDLYSSSGQKLEGEQANF